MLQDQVIPINFGQGLDTKTDPKLVAPGKLTVLENGIFTTTKRITKRNGYDKMSTLDSDGLTVGAAKLISTYKDELLMGDGVSLYGYSSGLGRWVNKGRYTSVGVQKTMISRGTEEYSTPDSATVGTLSVTAWRVGTGAGFFPVKISVLDTSSGNHLLDGLQIATLTDSVSCRKIGTSKVAVIYKSSVNNKIAFKIVSLVGGSVSVSAEIVVNTATVFCAENSGNYLLFALTDSSNTSLTIKKYDDTGSMVSGGTVLCTGGALALVSMSVNSAGYVWFFFSDGSNGEYAVANGSLLIVTLPTAIAGLKGALSSSETSTTAQRIYYGYSTSTPFAVPVYSTYYRDITIAGSVSAATTFLVGVLPASSAISVSGRSYMLFKYIGFGVSGAQNTLFLIDLSGGFVVARLLAGVLSNRVATAYANMSLVGSSVYFTAAEQFQFTSSSGIIDSLSSTVGYKIDFSGDLSYIAKKAGDLCVLSGGVISAYDGQSVSELGFNLFPDIMYTEVDTVSPAGDILAGTYLYYAVYQWYDANGNLHQSAPSLPTTVTVAGGAAHNSVKIYVSNAYLTQKISPASKVSIAIYRTENNGTTAHLVTNPTSPVTSDATQPYASFTDTFADTALIGNALMYTTGSVLENDAPPASNIIESHNNRLWALDAENPNNIWYSKTFQQGDGLAMSGFLIQPVDPKQGHITSINEMDEKLVIFKSQGLFVLPGDGANNVGTGSTLSVSSIPTDTGCINAKGTVLMPIGVIFKSQKGIYILDRSLSVKYLGIEVEKYNAYNITSSHILEDKNQVRFLTDNQVALVYDYVFNQWSVLTNHTGKSADNFGGSYVYARASGEVYIENKTSFLDDATSFALALEFGWMTLSSVQNFQRVRRLAMLGDYANGSSAAHAVKVSAAYDFVESFSTPIPYVFGSAASSAAFQFRERLPIQKCDAIKLRIEEVTNAVAGEYVDFTDMSFEAGIKKGMNKMPASRSVG